MYYMMLKKVSHNRCLYPVVRSRHSNGNYLPVNTLGRNSRWLSDDNHNFRALQQDDYW